MQPKIFIKDFAIKQLINNNKKWKALAKKVQIKNMIN